MLSRPSFKTALETFRAGLYRPRKPGAIGNRNSADLQLLDRLIDDWRTETIWRALQKQKPDAEPAAFIRILLDARRSATATIARTTSFKAQWEFDFFALKKRLAKLKQSAGPLAVADALDDAAARLRDRHAFHFGFADHAKFELSRKDQGGSRRRKLFMQIMADYFSQQFGAPLDDHAATLAEIALIDQPLHRDHARNARRPTTTRARVKTKRRGTFNNKKRG
jgi:hypothetical protein